MSFKVLSNGLDIIRDLLDEVLRGVMAIRTATVELYDVGVVEVTDLFKTCLEDVPLHILVYLAKLPQFAQNLLTNLSDSQTVEVFAQHLPVDCVEGHHEQLLHQKDLYVADLCLQLTKTLVLDSLAEGRVLIAESVIHFLEETVLDELDLVAGP